MPNASDFTGSSIAAARGGEGSGVGRHYRTRDSGMHSDGGTLRRYGGLVTGMARTFGKALEVDRSAILDAVERVSTFIHIDGREGTENPGARTNRIESEEHDREGVDRIFIALTTDQFEALGEALGADVTAR